ncbi:MAG: hypothetical protein LBG46_03145 [Elusimicrobiota bacterium]|jgi:hypothetical protein|nr:hypothetical protein [Elusimicrobiota bacterium]
MILVKRPIEGISLNGCEYLLDEKNNLMRFKTKTAAKAYIKEHLGFVPDYVLFEKE